MRFIKIKHPLLLISLLAVFLGNSSYTQPKSITILHTNDIHANFIPHEAFWKRETPKPLVSGFNELFLIADSIKKVKKALLLDAGDVMTGNPITEYSYKGAYGGALFEMMNMTGYDAWCPGNHDLDISQENLIKLTKIAKFPTLSANLVNSKNKLAYNNKEYVIFKKGGLRIGLIGIISQSLYNLVNKNNLIGIKVLSPKETTQRLVDLLDPKTDLIIALTHQGVQEDSILAANVTGLDVIIGGHSHTRLSTPKVVNDVIIVQAGSNCENLGELELTIENDKVVKYEGKLIQLWARESYPKNKLSNFVESFKNRIDKNYSEIIGELVTDWKRMNGESGIGNFITDVQRQAAHADVAFMNNHGIRKDLSAGSITKNDLFEVLPFRNVLTTFKLSGKQLKSIVEYYIQRKSPIQISGITAQYKKMDDGTIEFLKLEINGKQVDEEKMYICVANDYLVGEAKRHFGLEVNDAIYLKLTLFEEVEKAIRKAKKIDSKIENRIQEVN
ncbi:MAG: bifunctional UDP-sugar hydrolase/5'-nucleotidase [Bacteroidota bacterium]|nr:bifunctional UDP-sugar hydrolase/5'-nucleotidase [Bacteroidota bacterium]